MEEEKEELGVAEELTSLSTTEELTQLLRGG